MKLNEIAGNLLLSDNQKTILIVASISSTPTQAYEFTIGNLGLVIARNLLAKLGLVSISANQMYITEKGNQELINNNLIDETGQITDDARNLLKNNNIPIDDSSFNQSYQ